jgi:hypothetical protein
LGGVSVTATPQELADVIARVERRYKNEVAERADSLRNPEETVAEWSASVSFREWFALVVLAERAHTEALVRDHYFARAEAAEALAARYREALPTDAEVRRLREAFAAYPPKKKKPDGWTWWRSFGQNAERICENIIARAALAGAVREEDGE